MRRDTRNGLVVAGFWLMAILGLALAGSAVIAQEGEPEDAQQESLPDYTRGGADTCLRCHDGTEDPHLLSILDGPHGVMADERTPFGGNQCEACHGPGGDHAKRVRFGQERPPMPAFGPNSPFTEARENAICQDCHRGSDHRFWAGGTHQREDVACADCHTAHAKRDPITVTETESGVCLDCHQEQRAEVNRAFSHPIRMGEMACSDCHEPHGSPNEAMLASPTLNETCHECHAETRGPFLWEHAPVTEDCSECHRPHGSNHPGMLTRRAPLLCQQCHSRLGHPSVARTGESLPSGAPSGFLLSGSCMSCHSQVHGSNHPSGANLTR